MRKALILVFVAAIVVLSSCSRSYYHDAEVLSAYQRQAKAMCLAADAKSKLSTCRRAKACAEPAQRGLEAILVYEQANATMTATIDERIAADAAYAGAVAACGVAGVTVARAGLVDAGTRYDSVSTPHSDGGAQAHD